MTYGSPSSRCILIADDDQDIRELLRLYLESEGYRVREAVDGAEALGAVKAGGIDLVLLDIMMPRIDGYQVLRRLRETSALPVIMVSAKGQDPDKIIGLDLGADDYLTKPFNPLEALARTLVFAPRLRHACRRIARRPVREGSASRRARAFGARSHARPRCLRVA